MGLLNWLFGKKTTVLRIPEDWIKAADDQEAKGLPDIEVIGRPPKPSYEIVVGEGGQKAIKCLRCNMVSYSKGDIDHLWCDNCKLFHYRRKFGGI